MQLRFTPTEREILLHRLGVSDAIADALSEDYPDNDEVMYVAEQLRLVLSGYYGNRIIDTDEASRLELKILVDCCNGSTFFADADDAVDAGQINRGKLLAQQRAAGTLEARMTRAGYPVNIPRA